MNQPWDIPPLPTVGDESIDAVYSGVGRAINQWEGIEVGLSRIYSHFRRKPDDYETIMAYGAEKTFQVRFGKLQKAASQFFVAACDQELEGEFHRLGSMVSEFSNRRNDVAHGIVGPIQIYSWFLEKAKDLKPRTCYWALFPTYYEVREWKGRGLPEYAYTSVELLTLEGHLSAAYGELSTYRNKLVMHGARRRA